MGFNAESHCPALLSHPDLALGAPGPQGSLPFPIRMRHSCFWAFALVVPQPSCSSLKGWQGSSLTAEALLKCPSLVRPLWPPGLNKQTTPTQLLTGLPSPCFARFRSPSEPSRLCGNMFSNWPPVGPLAQPRITPGLLSKYSEGMSLRFFTSEMEIIPPHTGSLLIMPSLYLIIKIEQVVPGVLLHTWLTFSHRILMAVHHLLLCR